jgi:hypothetical protein
MKPRQIVGGFTYCGAVLDEAPGTAQPAGWTEQSAGWAELRALVRARQPLLSAPRATGSRAARLRTAEPRGTEPRGTEPRGTEPRGTELCLVCHGPPGQGSPLCFQCDLHRQCAEGSLADVVVPVAFAVKGSPHARQLWQYKSARLSAAARAGPTTTLRALLLVFLRDHGPCIWRAGGIEAPTQVAVVPTARGRQGTHPLRALIGPYLTAPWAELTARPGGEQARDLDPDRFAATVVPGARVLLIDDTWTTGSSAQSAAMALRRAGARSVATVVLGRHVALAAAERAGLEPAAMPFRPGSCAVHDDHLAAPSP